MLNTNASQFDLNVVSFGNVYVRLGVQLDVHGFICILYSSIFFALHVSGVICTHPQEHKLQRTAIGVCNLWKAEVISSIKRCGVIFFICVNLWICVCELIDQSYGCLTRYLCASVCVNEPALVLCGRDMWFLGEQNIRVMFSVLTVMVC
jgi:hypothetical protein